MKFNTIIPTILLSLLFLASCTSDDKENIIHNPTGNYDSGVLVLNEGNFGNVNAEISYISFDLNTSYHDIFKAENTGQLLGNTAQSIGFNGDLAYIVVNASKKIEIVNRYTMKKVGSITTGLSQPRYIAFAGGKGYVTDWGTVAGTAHVTVINTATNTITGTITVTDFPNKIIADNNKLYISHNDLGNKGNSITVLDATTNTVITSITTGDMPDDLAIDNNHELWVSCNGKFSYPVAAEESAGKILKINLNTNTVTRTFTLGSNTEHVNHFAVFGSNIFYTVLSKIYKFPRTATALPTTPVFVSAAEDLYGFAVKNNKIYVADSKLFAAKGVVYVYSSGESFDPNPVGTLLKSVEVGVGPNGFYFNQ